MAFIGAVPDEEAAELGTLTNYTRVLGHRPEVFRAWVQLNTSIKESMDLRRYELATVAAAKRLRSSYCALAHGSVLVDRFYDPATVREIVVDPSGAGLDEADLAIMDLAEQVVADATEITREDLERLRAHGLDDGEIVSVVLAAAARCFFSKTLDALGIEPDASYAELDPELRDVLVVGRPIAAAC
jgi:uncharacterized peroxidase-related enzyme